jgi:hypothetical protein
MQPLPTCTCRIIGTIIGTIGGTFGVSNFVGKCFGVGESGSSIHHSASQG